MEWRKAALFLTFMLIAASSAAAETLYRWIDSQGVQRYSNQPPPAEVKLYQVIQAEKESPGIDQERPEYRRMMQRVEQENRENEASARQREEQRAAEKKRRAEAERQASIEQERQSLQQQIEEIQKRALGPHFTPGMRQSQIEAIQKKIDALEEQK